MRTAQRVRGDECYTFPPTDECPFPDVNKTAVQGRNLLFQEFEVVKFVEVILWECVSDVFVCDA